VSFAPADFRDLATVSRTFDVVLSCDNALAHLLDEAQVVSWHTTRRAIARCRAPS
jgi:hypothetical protein